MNTPRSYIYHKIPTCGSARSDNKTIFSLNEAGQEDSVRAFTASELLFTGGGSQPVGSLMTFLR